MRQMGARVKTLVSWSLIVALGCAGQPQVAPPAPPSVPTSSVTVSHWPAHGCAGEHDMVSFGPNLYINAYPNWPPAGKPGHLVLHYANGDVIWGKPSYGAANCQTYETCQRATFIVNPIYQKCVPTGRTLEVVTLDGRPVLESSLLINDPQTKSTFYIAFANGVMVAGPDLSNLAAQLQSVQAQAAQAAASQGTIGSQPGWQAFGAALGITLGAALALGITYLAARQQSLDYAAQTQQEQLNYMAATRPINCRSFWAGSTWVTRCF